jgi:hypothetical protein
MTTIKPIHHIHQFLLKISQQFATLSIAARVRLLGGLCLLAAGLCLSIFLLLANVLMTQTSMAKQQISTLAPISELLKQLIK